MLPWRIIPERLLFSFFNFFPEFKIFFSLALFPLHFSLLIPSFPATITTVVRVHESPFLFAQPLTLTLPAQLPSCSLAMSLSLFCLLVQFVHYFPHMSEILWYLPFSDWLTSLSIMFSRSIHTVTKGKRLFFLWLHSIPCVNVLYMFYSLIY